MLSPRGVVLPQKLLCSQHLALLRQRREERERGGRGRKRRRGTHKNYYNQLSRTRTSVGQFCRIWDFCRIGCPILAE